MKILIIGSGGREHAIAWKLAQSNRVTQIFVAPGNAGTAQEFKTENVALDPLDFKGLVQFAKTKAITYTIVGPEIPLAAGIVDYFQAEGLLCLGPTRNAAKLESSKAFSKAFMARHHIPTASYKTFTDVDAAYEYLNKQSFPIVIKADGLAAGKGVIIAHNQLEARNAIVDLLEKNIFKQTCPTIVIEDFMEGTEASFILLMDGTHFVTLASAQDHKTRDEQGLGPNTGGMGAFSPNPIITPELSQQIIDTIIQPTLKGIQMEGLPFCGFLFVGLMITKNNIPNVLEFNCRLGDPETQVILPRLENDLAELCFAALNKNLADVQLRWSSDLCLGVILASHHYPDQPITGELIQGLENINDPLIKIFHSATVKSGENFLTHGGRVLCVTTKANDLNQARKQAYYALENIHWPQLFYRRDIGIPFTNEFSEFLRSDWRQI